MIFVTVGTHEQPFDRLIEEMRINKKLCGHLHVSLQSGSERILKLMDRKYTKEEYEEIMKDTASAYGSYYEQLKRLNS